MSHARRLLAVSVLACVNGCAGEVIQDSDRPSETVRSGQPAAEDVPRRHPRVIDVIDTRGLDVVRSREGALEACANAAREVGAIEPGRHEFLLAWKILPSGLVENPTLKAPQSAVGTRLAKCFLKEMRSWRFPKTNKGAKVDDYPLLLDVQ